MDCMLYKGDLELLIKSSTSAYYITCNELIGLVLIQMSNLTGSWLKLYIGLTLPCGVVLFMLYNNFLHAVYNLIG